MRRWPAVRRSAEIETRPASRRTAAEPRADRRGEVEDTRSTLSSSVAARRDCKRACYPERRKSNPVCGGRRAVRMRQRLAIAGLIVVLSAVSQAQQGLRDRNPNLAASQEIASELRRARLRY